MCIAASLRLYAFTAAELRDVSDREPVDHSRHYLNRRSRRQSLLDLILEHFEALEHWSSDLLR